MMQFQRHWCYQHHLPHLKHKHTQKERKTTSTGTSFLIHVQGDNCIFPCRIVELKVSAGGILHNMDKQVKDRTFHFKVLIWQWDYSRWMHFSTWVFHQAKLGRKLQFPKPEDLTPVPLMIFSFHLIKYRDSYYSMPYISCCSSCTLNSIHALKEAPTCGS